MPLRNAIPLLKSNIMFRSNGNLVSTFFLPVPQSGANNSRKLFLPTNNTLDGVFDSTQLTRGNSGGSADLVRVWNHTTGTFVSYFYRTGFGWRDSFNRTGPDQADVVLPNNTEYFFTFILAKTITLKGQAKVSTRQTTKYP
jgi:hypothetical protein